MGKRIPKCANRVVRKKSSTLARSGVRWCGLGKDTKQSFAKIDEAHVVLVKDLCTNYRRMSAGRCAHLIHKQLKRGQFRQAGLNVNRSGLKYLVLRLDRKKTKLRGYRCGQFATSFTVDTDLRFQLGTELGDLGV